MHRALYGSPRRLENAEVLIGQTLVYINQSYDSVTATIRSLLGVKQRFTGKLVVVADGGEADTRKLVGQQLLGYTWLQKAASIDIVTYVELPADTGVSSLRSRHKGKGFLVHKQPDTILQTWAERGIPSGRM